jgi:hypothetical protein
MNTDDDQPRLSDETSPVDSHQQSSRPLEPESTKPCRYCRQEIKLEAKVCHLCRYHQRRYVQYFPYIQSVGLILTIVALMLGSRQLEESRQQRISASEAMRSAHSANERASESVTKVEALVVQVQAAETKVEGLVTRAHTIEQQVLETEERQILRIWVNMLPDESELMNPVTGAKPKRGQIRAWVGAIDTSTLPFQIKLGSNLEWMWTCDDDNLRKLTQLIERWPYVPYATVARADCLKKQGDPSWKADAERAKVLLEKMIALQPHPKEIDDFYATCLSLLQAP